MTRMLVDERCAPCTSFCAGTPIHCQLGATDWLMNTITAFGGTMATAHKVVGLWLDDPIVCPTDGPPPKPRTPYRKNRARS